jgi:hypothetical protein
LGWGIIAKSGQMFGIYRTYLLNINNLYRIIVFLFELDTEGLRQQALEGFQMGFTGKQLIHPGQVDICQESFTPSPEKIEWARELIHSFAAHQDSGKVVCSLKELNYIIAGLFHKIQF